VVVRLRRQVVGRRDLHLLPAQEGVGYVIKPTS
jgi:hypothetical protein